MTQLSIGGAFGVVVLAGLATVAYGRQLRGRRRAAPAAVVAGAGNESHYPLMVDYVGMNEGEGER